MKREEQLVEARAEARLGDTALTGLPPPAGEDIDFAVLVGVMKRRWRVLLGAVLAGLAATAALVAMSGRTYEAIATLSLSGSAATGSSNANAVRTILTSPAVLQDVNQSLAAEGFQAGLDADAIIVDPVTNTALVRLRVRLPQPDRAARAAVLLAQRGGAIARQMRDKAVESAGDSIDADVRDAARQLEAAEHRLLEFRRKSQLEVVEEEVQAQLARRRAAQTIAADIDRERARYEAAMKEVQRLRAAAGSTSQEQDASVIASLGRVLAESRTTIAALEQARRENASKASGEVKALGELHRLEMELARLRRAVDVAEQVYAARTVRANQLQPVQAIPLMELVEDTIPPGAPVGKELWRKLALGLVLSALLAMAVALAIEAIGSRPGPRASVEGR